MLLDGGGCYHCISRVVDRQFIFGPAEKEFFVTTMRKLEAFLGVKVLTYCVMSNHFHLLVEVPDPNRSPELTVEVLKERLPLLYHGNALTDACDEIERALQAAGAKATDGPNATLTSGGGSSRWLDAILARYQARMLNLSVFLKELKWRFTMWHNARAERVGTLWEDRFRSVLVEGDEQALMTIAAYIELNPIRAALVDDPEDYRWCGYAEAVAGKKIARINLARMHSRLRAWQGAGKAPVTWREVGSSYRKFLFGSGQQRLGNPRTGRGAKPGIDPARAAAVIEGRNGRLPVPERLLQRVTYFSAGAAVGSEAFVESVFNSFRDQFGKNRKTGARAMRGANWGDLKTLREIAQPPAGD